jgi:hypothetical protein
MKIKLKGIFQFINENPDFAVYDFYSNDWDDEDAYAFGYLDGKFLIDKNYFLNKASHPKMYAKEKKEYDKVVRPNGGFDHEYVEKSRNSFKMPGRLWTDSKTISFWKNPSLQDFKKFIIDLKNVSSKKFGKPIIINKSWRIEYKEEQWQTIDQYFKNNKKQLTQKKDLSKETDHVISPLMKNKKFNSGFGSKKYNKLASKLGFNSTAAMNFKLKQENKILEQKSYDNFEALKNIAGKREKKFEVYVIPVLTKAFQENLIYNADYNECKFFINNSLEDYFKNFMEILSKKYNTNFYHLDISYFDISLFRFNTFLKKLQKFSLPAVEELKEELLKLKPFVDQFNNLKDHVVKGRKPNPNAKPVYVAPPSSIGDLKKVHDIFTNIIKEIYDEHFSNTYKFYESLVEQYIKRRKNSEESPSDFFGLLFGSYIVDKVVKRKYNKISMRWSSDFVLDPNWKQKIHQITKEHIEQIHNNFIFKMKKKITSIIGNKGGLKNVKALKLKVSNNLIESDILFTFLDGSEFTLQNQIVQVWNHRTPHIKFPSTFHKIKINNQKYQMKSEEWMNNNFSK